MKFLILISLISCSSIIAQHLPHQIGNQWHYDWVVGWSNYAAIAVEQVSINGIDYFKIERRHYNTGELLETTYDRLEGDSTYYRIRNGEESLIINFNWPDGYTQITQIDSNCISISVLHREFRIVWGFNTESFTFSTGYWCEGLEDTLWVLSPPIITRMFGSYLWNFDGNLKGAIIDGISYGTLHPLPVELVSFTASSDENNVTLSWITATETNNQGFEILRLAQNDNNDWVKIGFINGHGTTTETKSYSYTDINLSPGKYQYRLKQIDFDGTFEYSEVVEVDVLFPEEFILHQNYPNPFNPITKISWQVPNDGWQTLIVYDLLGREVTTLVDEERNAGTYEIEFNASGLAGLSSGTYFYSLRAGNSIQIKKMTLIK